MVVVVLFLMTKPWSQLALVEYSILRDDELMLAVDELTLAVDGLTLVADEGVAVDGVVADDNGWVAMVVDEC